MSSVSSVGAEARSNDRGEFGQDAVGRFLLACSGGQDIEELILRDAARQRRTACGMRRFCRESQRRAVAEAAQKIIDAAWKDFYAAAFGAAVQMGVSYACYRLEVASGLAQSGAASDLEKLLVKAKYSACKELVNAGGTLLGGLGSVIPGAAKDRAKAELMQVEASIAGQQGQDAGEWLRNIKELESKLVSHLERILDLEQQAKKTVIERMGS